MCQEFLRTKRDAILAHFIFIYFYCSLYMYVQYSNVKIKELFSFNLKCRGFLFDAYNLQHQKAESQNFISDFDSCLYVQLQGWALEEVPPLQVLGLICKPSNITASPLPRRLEAIRATTSSPDTSLQRIGEIPNWIGLGFYKSMWTLEVFFNTISRFSVRRSETLTERERDLSLHFSKQVHKMHFLKALLKLWWQLDPVFIQIMSVFFWHEPNVASYLLAMTHLFSIILWHILH